MLSAEEVADKLQGTCGSLDDFASDGQISDLTFCAALDELVFCCDGCGWWCERGDESNEMPEHCSQCAEEHKEGG